ncbi:aberrant root formation protein 4-like [Hibiscus syriacus]|uniref:aberrant root formation protein 4-like n=1 Tax=Hibiscus syriacus TaxID=106335 RepID=UPI0019248BFA|nr:aberrant root formation protein 4-like [Hibiscus syriacus]
MAEFNGSSSANALLLKLHQILTSCSKSISGGDFSQSQTSESELVNFLDSVSDAALSEPENEDAKANAFKILSEIYQFLCSPSLDHEIIDALSFELPKSASKFAGISPQCLEVADNVIRQFIQTSSPRDMLSVICEALDSPNKTIKAAAYISPLISGLSYVFLSIQRRLFEQIKVAVPVVVKVVKVISLETDSQDTELETLFDRVVVNAHAIQTVCSNMENGEKEKLRALLGLYVLQILALISVSSNHLSFALQLASFLPYCGTSCLGLVTGSSIDTLSGFVIGEDEEDCSSISSHVYLGASLSVILAQKYDEFDRAAKLDLSAVKTELQNNQTKRWQAIGMLKHIFSSFDLPWEFKSDAVDFLLYITSGDISNELDDEHNDCSRYMTSIFSALQAVTMIIIYTSDVALRKNTFEALKRVLGDIPDSQRYDILKALIKNSDSSSMVAILLDLVRGEMHRERTLRMSICKDEALDVDNKSIQKTLFWCTSILELVESVLRPVSGGPPILPDNSDAVLSALNLYRYVLMTESAGETNYTGVRSKNNLKKAHNEWLLPLRVLVSSMEAANKNDHGQLAVDTVCALNPVELVLYRCLELVEENLKHPV